MVCSIGRLYAKVEDYTQSDSYYIKGGGINQSEWYGKGAAQLELSGTVKPEDYHKAYKGLDPEGKALRQQQAGKKQNPGRDITLSAPKSVALVGLVKGDQQVLLEHKAAVRTAMDYVERNCIFTRTGKGGKERYQTDNALFAIFHHDDNRNQDPLVHSHCIAFNQTAGADGKWRSMDNRELYQQKMTIGTIYHHELGRRLKALGYELEWNRDGTFEVAGYTQQQLEVFSTRRSEIVAAVGMDASAEVKAQACTITRKNKTYKTAEERESLEVTWQQRAEAAGIEHPQPKLWQNLEESYNYSSHPGSTTELLHSAIEVKCDRAVAFPRHALLKETLIQSQGNYSLEEIERAINREQNLIKTKDGRITTAQAVERETHILQKAQARKGGDRTLATAQAAQEKAREFGLNAAQERALSHFATNQDAVMLCQGDAGVGKTYTLKALQEIVPANQPVRGLAPSAAAAEVLQQDAGISCQTLDAYLMSPRQSLPQNELIVVDEAGMVSSRQMQALLERLQQTNSRAILIGDTKQLSAVEAGSPFKLLQEQAGLPTVGIDLNVRQQNPQLKATVALIAAGKIEQGYQQLQQQGNIKQIPIDSKRFQVAVNDYLSTDKETRAKTLILAGTNAEKQIVTAQVRQELLARGQLGVETKEITVLRRKDLSTFAIAQANSYEPGNVVKFHQDFTKFSRDLFYRVDRVDARTQTVILRDKYGSTQTLELNKYKQREVFQAETREIRAGEQMKFTRNQYKQNQVNGQRFTVIELKDDGEIIVQTKGKTQAVNSDALLHSDYIYADTVHSSQGKTANRCIYVASSGNSPTVGRESFYVAASRARQEFIVYTASAKDLGLSVQQSRGQENALPLVASHPSPSKSKPVTPPSQTRSSSIEPQRTLQDSQISVPSPTREQEFKLLVQSKYLVEEKGERNPQNSKEKIYKSPDGTEIKLNGDRLIIKLGGSELEFGRDNATVKNTFSWQQMQEQIQARTVEAKQFIAIDRSRDRGRGISR